MMLFWILTVAMILLALAIMTPALLKKGPLPDLDRDQQNVVIAKEALEDLQSEFDRGNLTKNEFEQGKLELEQSLIIDLSSKANPKEGTSIGGKGGKVALLGSAIVVSVLTIGIYLQLGEPRLIDPSKMPATVANQEMHSIDEVVVSLIERLETNPTDAQGWYMLGRTYMATKNYGEAAKAFEKLYSLAGDEPRVLLSFADALIMANGGSIAGRPTELVRKAVSIAPEDTTALWLGGMAEEGAGNYELAINYWTRLQPQLTGEENRSSLQRVNQLIAGAQAKLESQSTLNSAPVYAAAEVSAANIKLHVQVSEHLRDKIGQKAALYVYARPSSGPKMPLAVVRLNASDLPANVVLDDSTAMTENLKLSTHEEVVVGALISNTGSATAKPGDLRGEVHAVPVSVAKPVLLSIDSVVQ